MKKFKRFNILSVKNIVEAGMRFPLTIIVLGIITFFASHIIINFNDYPFYFIKIILAASLGAVLALAMQITCERFKLKNIKRLIAYVMSIAVLAFFYLGLPAKKPIDAKTWHMYSILFLFFICVALFIPSFKTKTSFNKIARIFFKYFFLSILYAGILHLGLAAILFAIDTLLFIIDSDLYIYLACFIWCFFAPFYFLAILPHFNAEPESEPYTKFESVAQGPKFFEILISYIFIPLISIYTLILASYFFKILISWKWPVGQLGPMILGYSIAGLIIFVLAGESKAKINALFAKLFPFFLSPLALLQLVSVFVRLHAYSLTVSRYYVTLFGIFSFVIGIVLIFSKHKKHESIAYGIALCALISIFPSINSYTVARISQEKRLETILASEKMIRYGAKLDLSNSGSIPKQIVPNPDARVEAQKEIISIVNYLDRIDELDKIKWIPEDFNARDWKQFETLFGFEKSYGYNSYDDKKRNYTITDKTLHISGYDYMFEKNFWGKDNQSTTFTIGDSPYELKFQREHTILNIQLVNEFAQVVLDLNADSFIKNLYENFADGGKLEQERLSIQAEQNGFKLKIIFTSIDIEPQEETYVVGTCYFTVLLGKSVE